MAGLLSSTMMIMNVPRHGDAEAPVAVILFFTHPHPFSLLSVEEAADDRPLSS